MIEMDFTMELIKYIVIINMRLVSAFILDVYKVILTFAIGFDDIYSWNVQGLNSTLFGSLCSQYFQRIKLFVDFDVDIKL